jgi:UDP-2,4-diacetamido-2,4,6-trideoxy-beta-L-altropyranose hydrolase
VDGRGAHRVVREIAASFITLKPATTNDARLLWEWANDPSVRMLSFSSNSIPWDNHVRWLDEKLRDPACSLLIAELPNNQAIGQVRFDFPESETIISISLGAEFRGMGFAGSIIQLGCQRIFSERSIDCITAYIKPENSASIKAFENSGFIFKDLAIVRSQPARRYTLHRICKEARQSC